MAGALVGNDGGGKADVACLPGSWGGGGARVWTGHGVSKHFFFFYKKLPLANILNGLIPCCTHLGALVFTGVAIIIHSEERYSLYILVAAGCHDGLTLKTQKRSSCFRTKQVVLLEYTF